MRPPIFAALTLTMSGTIAAAVGLGILAAPRAFHASMGIALGDDVNLLNEMRSSGGIVLACGLFALLGAVRGSLAFPALAASAALYLGYGLSRAVSVALDGVPGAAMVQIMALELALAGLCLLALRSLRRARTAAA